MKRILYVIVLSVVLLSSCKDYLDTVPTSSLSGLTGYTTEPLIKSNLAGIYLGLKGMDLTNKYSAYAACQTDESYPNSTAANFGLYNWSSSNSNTSTYWLPLCWQYSYKSIAACNEMLKYIDASSAGNVDTATVRKYKGEAYFMRGYYYFMLVQWFGGLPMYLTPVEDISQIPVARTPEKDVYDQIISDMTTAESMMYDVVRAKGSATETDRVNRTTVQGMLARVFLYAAGKPVNGTTKYTTTDCYKKAAYWASRVINSGRHSLIGENNTANESYYKKVFTDEQNDIYNDENMWEVDYAAPTTLLTYASGQLGIYCGINHTYSDTAYCTSQPRLHPRLLVSFEPGDYRRDINCANYQYKNNSTKVSGSTTLFQYNDAKVPLQGKYRFWSKYPGKWRRENESLTSKWNKSNNLTNYPLLRYSDVLLMYAEALNELDANGVSYSLTPDQYSTLSKYDAINKVRLRSISPTQIVDSITWTQGTGYLTVPTLSVASASGSGAVITPITYYSKTASPTVYQVDFLLTAQGSGYTTAPTVTVNFPVWTAGSTFSNTDVTNKVQFTAGTQLYTVTQAGTSGTTAPISTSTTAFSATGGTAKFKYAGLAATITKVYLSPARTSVTLAALTADQFRNAIKTERYHEFCFEGLRQQDLRRWGILQSTVKDMAADADGGATRLGYTVDGINTTYVLYPSISSDFGTSNGLYFTNLMKQLANSIGDKDWYLPILQTEININPKIVQNPGY